MHFIDWKSALQCCAYDASVGIKIARLAGDRQFASYLTVIDAGHAVKAHYHTQGDEHYHILEGEGEVMLKDVHTLQEKILFVRQQQSFVVTANTWHQLKNTGSEPLVLMFSCPESHLGTDRYLS